ALGRRLGVLAAAREQRGRQLEGRALGRLRGLVAAGVLVLGALAVGGLLVEERRVEVAVDRGFLARQERAAAGGDLAVDLRDGVLLRARRGGRGRARVARREVRAALRVA